MTPDSRADVAIAGGGLAGLATAFESLERGLRVLILDRDAEDALGGLAKRSFGGVMFVDTPQQRKLGIRDTPELAWSDWQSFADFGADDAWPQRWARTYVERSTEMIYDWLTGCGVDFLPVVNWAERGLFRPGNSVPRWHIAWGTGHAIIEAVVAALDRHPHRDRLEIRCNHRVDRLVVEAGRVVGCAGSREDDGAEFEVRADHVVLASGGICGGDLGKVRANWYAPWGEPPSTLLNGSHRFADGLLHDEAARHGAALTHLDKQWHYAAGVHGKGGDTPLDGISLVPPRSALWLDARGRRFGPVPLMGYSDTRWLVEQICRTPEQYSWQVLNWKIAIKELAVSGCDYMTAFRHKKKIQLVKEVRLRKPGPGQPPDRRQRGLRGRRHALRTDGEDGASVAAGGLDRPRTYGGRHRRLRRPDRPWRALFQRRPTAPDRRFQAATRATACARAPTRRSTTPRPGR